MVCPELSTSAFRKNEKPVGINILWWNFPVYGGKRSVKNGISQLWNFEKATRIKGMPCCSGFFIKKIYFCSFEISVIQIRLVQIKYIEYDGITSCFHWQ